MGIFKSKEDKAAANLEKARQTMNLYGLDTMDDKYINAVQGIQLELAGSGMLEFGLALTGKPEDNAKLAYLHALVLQNWILMRQLDDIAKKLK